MTDNKEKHYIDMGSFDDYIPEQLPTVIKPLRKQKTDGNPNFHGKFVADGDYSKTPLHAEGHRERVRQRFLKGRFDGFSDHEVLEMALFYTIARIDTKWLAKQLIEEFGSVEKVFYANYERLYNYLSEVRKRNGHPYENECRNTAIFLNYIRSLSNFLWRKKSQNKVIQIGNGTELINYLEASMRDLNTEEMRIIYLNNGNVIIKDEVASEGTEDQTSVYPKKIMKRALELSATSIIVVHNHPAGTMRPSNADINITKCITKAAEILGIRVLDHLIIGDRKKNTNQEKGYYSFRENGLL